MSVDRQPKVYWVYNGELNDERPENDDENLYWPVVSALELERARPEPGDPFEFEEAVYAEKSMRRQRRIGQMKVVVDREPHLREIALARSKHWVVVLAFARRGLKA